MLRPVPCILGCPVCHCLFVISRLIDAALQTLIRHSRAMLDFRQLRWNSRVVPGSVEEKRPTN
jgi:hypothetical protein